MSKTHLSVGTDTPTGEPANGPAGPYVTDEHDDELAAALRRPANRRPRKNRREQSSPTADRSENHRAPPAKNVGRAKGPAQPDDMAPED
jgi:hypothetical protein